MGYPLTQPNVHGLMWSLNMMSTVFLKMLSYAYFNDDLIEYKRCVQPLEVVGMNLIPWMYVLCTSLYLGCQEYLEENQWQLPWPEFGTVWDLATFERLAMNSGNQTYIPLWLGSYADAFWNFMDAQSLKGFFLLQSPQTVATLKGESNPGSQLLDLMASQAQALYLGGSMTGASSGPVANDTYVEVFNYLADYSLNGFLDRDQVATCKYFSPNTKGNIIETLGWIFFEKNAQHLIFGLTYLTFHMAYAEGYPFSRNVTTQPPISQTPILDSIWPQQHQSQSRSQQPASWNTSY